MYTLIEGWRLHYFTSYSSRCLSKIQSGLCTLGKWRISRAHADRLDSGDIGSSPSLLGCLFRLLISVRLDIMQYKPLLSKGSLFSQVVKLFHNISHVTTPDSVAWGCFSPATLLIGREATAAKLLLHLASCMFSASVKSDCKYAVTAGFNAFVAVLVPATLPMFRCHDRRWAVRQELIHSLSISELYMLCMHLIVLPVRGRAVTV